MIHNILAQHRALESRWHSKKIKLHQRLALRLFQEDVKQGAVHKLHRLIHPFFIQQHFWWNILRIEKQIELKAFILKLLYRDQKSIALV